MQQPSDEATTEQRAKAVKHWEEVIRPQMATREQKAPPEDPQVALARIKSEGWGSVQISPALTKILGIKKNEQAA
ncbi:hypothetical protein [Microvirga sp. Mcv34]|uniref:hypothetical protein n=1 Tax=Microvirga sp. Mcv34 TaxID=2926016 RepID=UPI0021C6818D|nr:hypothetical protein [Microvirga sp. Mcv34]